MLVMTSLYSISYSAPNGFYAGLGIGGATGPTMVNVNSNSFAVNTGSGNIIDTYGLETRDHWAGHALLGYNINKYFGVEVNYSHWGKQDLLNFNNNVATPGGFSGTSKINSYGFDAIGYLPVRSHLDFFGELGIAASHSNLNITDPNGVIFPVAPGNYGISETNAAITYGAGLQLYLNKNLNSRLQWKRLSNLTSNNRMNNISSNMLTVSLIYAFNNV